MAPKTSAADKAKAGTDKAPETEEKSKAAAQTGTKETDDSKPAGGLTDEQIAALVSEARAEGEAAGKEAGLAEGQEKAAERHNAELEGKRVLTAEEVDELEKAAHRKGYEEALEDERTEPQPGTEPQEDLTGVGTDASTALGFDWSRVSIISLVLRLPENLRRGGLTPPVNDLSAWLETLPSFVQPAAADMVRAIAEVRPADIVNGKYKLDVQSGLNVLMGEAEGHRGGFTHEDQSAAMDRLRRAKKDNAEPAGFRLNDSGEQADEEQGKSRSRLYSGQQAQAEQQA